MVTGGGLYAYFQNEKKKIEERKRETLLYVNETHYIDSLNPFRPRNGCPKGWKTENRGTVQAHYAVRN